ncbi:MAG TPA: electron transfer flavoprotein subunit beta/FixA family protein [Candidatus Acidoferrales bacterium]|nr:electron transfer flavoprotein subunit beta/FixA family protein [Candidatus Acidoferrales bacterium]
MRIVVLLKPVPVVGTEKLADGWMVDRSSGLEANGNDEYVLEAALKIVEAHGGEVVTLTMGPAPCTEAIRKALAMGATRAVHVVDSALAGSDALATGLVLAAALGRMEYDLAMAGADTSDGQGGIVGAAVAVHLGLPYLSYAAAIEPDPGAGTVRVRRISPTGYDVMEARMPALVAGTQLLGEPRYPSLRGIMQARSREIASWSLADLGLGPAEVGSAAARTVVDGAVHPPERAGATVVREAPDAAVERIVDFLSARRLI